MKSKGLDIPRSQLKLGFFDNYISVRGTTNAISEYARYHSLVEGGESIVFYLASNTENDASVAEYLGTFCKLVAISDISELPCLMHELEVDILYMSVASPSRVPIEFTFPVVAHCVFEMNSGDLYKRPNIEFAAVSPYIKNYVRQCKVLPHILRKPTKVQSFPSRESLGFTCSDLVVGRIGAYETFDLSVNISAILNALDSRRDLCFIMVNTKPFDVPQKHKQRVMFLPKIVSREEKFALIGLCDCMLWGGSMGETFGIAVGEFCIMNKPIICCATGSSIAHMHYVGKLGISYSTSHFYIEKITAALTCFFHNRELRYLRKALYYLREWSLNLLSVPLSVTSPRLETVLNQVTKSMLRKKSQSLGRLSYYSSCTDHKVMDVFYSICWQLLSRQRVNSRYG